MNLPKLKWRLSGCVKSEYPRVRKSYLALCRGIYFATICHVSVGFCQIFDRIYLLQKQHVWNLNPQEFGETGDTFLGIYFLTIRQEVVFGPKIVSTMIQSIGWSFVYAPGSMFLCCHPVNMYIDYTLLGRDENIKCLFLPKILVKIVQIYLVTLHLFWVWTHIEAEEKYYLWYMFSPEIIRK